MAQFGICTIIGIPNGSVAAQAVETGAPDCTLSIFTNPYHLDLSNG